MRGRAAAVLLLSFLSTLPLFANCNFAPRYSGQFRATVFDVAVDGDFVWTATGYGVQLLAAGARGPQRLDSAALPGSTRVIATGGGGLAYAGSGDRVYVLRRNGSRIEIVRSVSAPGAVNDILVHGHLFAATRNGIAHYDLVDPANPIRTTAILTTSRPNVTALTLGSRDTMYAADGDATLEVFNVSIPSIPQRTGSIDVLPRAAAVHATGDGFLFVSDELGQNTDILAGAGARLARVPYGATAFAATTSGAYFVAGGDRTLRAIELSDPANPGELFERRLAPTGGTSNAIFDLARSGNTLYVAAGDIGLLTFDVSTLAPPFPLLSSAEGGATTSALIIDGSVPKAYFTSASAQITETGLDLNPIRSGSTPDGPSVIHDSRGSDLLISAGNKVALFSLSAPATFDATFRAEVRQAVLVGDTIVALLADQSVWSVRAAAGSTPQQVDTGGAKISFLARSSNAYALAEIREDGTTVVHLPSRKVTVEGVATGGLALSATHAALFTFHGINLVDIATGEVSVLPDSTGVIPRQLQFAGTSLLILGDRTLTVWDVTRRTLARTYGLPANAVRMHAAAQRAAIATDEGMIAINYGVALPDLVAEPHANAYYTKVVAGREHIHLFGEDGVDIYSTANSTAPLFVAAIREAGLIDIAATPDLLFTLAGDGAVTAYSHAGVAVARNFATYAPDSQPEAIFTAGNAVWATISRGCQSGVCVKETVVMDPRTLAMAGVIAGGVVDVTVSGTRAYAILDLPRELAAFDISQPLAPSMTAHVAAPDSASSIAFAFDRVFVLGDSIYAYTASLAPAGEFYERPSAPQTQQIELAADCLFVIGRQEYPERFSNDELLSASPLTEVPSALRSMAAQGDRVYLLTEHSIEVWTLTPPPAPKRRRSAR